MAKKDKPKVRYRYRKEKSARRRRDLREVHLIPDLIAVGAVALPAVSGREGWGNDPIGTARNGQYGAAMQEYVANAISEKWEIAGLFVASYAAKWLGKKLGLNHVGTKKIRVM